MNLPWDQNEIHEVIEEGVVEKGRPRRIRRAPDCGIGGRLDQHH